MNKKSDTKKFMLVIAFAILLVAYGFAIESALKSQQCQQEAR